MKEIKIGDWVYIPAINEKGEVIGGYLDTTWNEKSYHVRMEDGRELDVLESNCKLADYDPKTAFLEELQSLLRKHDAKIHVWAGDDGDKVLTFELKDNIDISYPNEWLNDYKFEFPITPDNIFNYDKE